MSRAALYTVNATDQIVAAGGQISPGGIIRRFGCNADIVGGNITLNGSGYYEVSAQITLTGTTAGNTTIELLKDGVAIPGAETELTLAVGVVDTIGINTIVRQMCFDGASTLTFVLTGTAATVNNISTVVTKL